MILHGMEVVANHWLTEGYRRARKHRKRRIDKKWWKRYGFVGIPSKKLYIVDGKLVGHPATIKAIMKELEVPND